MQELKGKIAVVTGGASGIGKAICLAFSEQGVNLVIPDINMEKAEQTCREIEKAGRNALPMEANVSKLDDVDMVFDKTLEAYGQIDILVNNAGTTHPAISIFDLDLEYVEKIFSVDYKGVYLCSRRAGREMVKRRQGCVINISSIAGLTPLPLAMYGPMKSAVNMLTQILAREWARYGIRVNAIAPGYVLTSLIKDLISKGERDPKLILERTPMNTMLEPEDIANSAMFLASSKARYITGAIIPVDGGWLSDGGWSAYKR